MTFTETELAGVFEVLAQPARDDRGFFARVWCSKIFAERGLNPNAVQMNVSFNDRAGTLRGMHYQSAPFAETKLVRVTSGAVWDVTLDLRPDSATYLRWFGIELSAANRRMVYIPEGCAHGYLTLEDRSEVSYLVTAPYDPSSARGVRWDDPGFAIRWPQSPQVISQRDGNWPLFA